MEFNLEENISYLHYETDKIDTSHFALKKDINDDMYFFNSRQASDIYSSHHEHLDKEEFSWNIDVYELLENGNINIYILLFLLFLKVKMIRNNG